MIPNLFAVKRVVIFVFIVLVLAALHTIVVHVALLIIVEVKEVEVEVEVEDEVEKKKKSGQAAPVRHHFGANGKVLLTDDDLEKLYEAHGQEDTMAAIEIMDGYLTANGRSYKNYRQALENWAYRAVEENKQKGIQAKKYNNGEFPQTDLSEQLQAVEEAMLERQGAKRA